MTFDSVRTKVTASVMTTAVCIWTVTASAEQMPSTCTVMGLLSESGSASALRDFLFIATTPLTMRAVQQSRVRTA